MDISLGKRYYVEGTADTIYWPMSLVSWAYPTQEDGKTPDRDNMHSEYIAVQFNEEAAKEQILEYMSQVPGLKEGDERLKLTFTIAGADVDDHPCYSIFDQAAKILNECGWDIQVVPDTQALTKLATGSLTVWAAAWGSTIDPDLYQVYHKNSTATSTYAWGYREILSGPESQYGDEKAILDELSALIDDARGTDDEDERSRIYKEAMSLILDLAVELPVYQRNVLYAYNSNIIDSDSIPKESELNPYSSPLDRIWELEFAD
jgi:peptide/nickel transport system substrate-binding protein